MIGNLAQQTSSGHWAEAVVKDIGKTRGAVAFVWAVIFGTVLLTVFPLEWEHDLKPNIDFFANSPLVGAQLATMYGSFVAQGLAMALPILLNSVMSRLAGFFKIAAGIVIVIEGIDAYIDWPSASVAFNAWWAQPNFRDAPFYFLFAWGPCRIIWQILCTDGFELICAAALVGFIVSVFGIFRKG
jgi:hypothetical protein